MTELANNGIITSYEYDANGNMTTKTQDNGVVSKYTYNYANLMSKYESNGLSTSFIYKVDGLMKGATNSDRLNSFDYDKAGRLVYESTNDLSGSDYTYIRYEYDSYGNRTKKTETQRENSIQINQITTDYQYDLNNKLINSSYSDTLGNSGATRYYYDHNGNQTAVQRSVYGSAGETSGDANLTGWGSDTGTGLYHYDSFNRLTEYITNAGSTSYTYGADNLRTSKTVNGERTDFAWNGQNLAIEDTAGLINTYTYDMTGVHIANQNGKVVSYLKDWHNNIVGTVKPNGTVVESLDKQQMYDAWGNIVNSADFVPFGYTGEYHDSETGLIYLRNRYYDPETGRFITEDPAKDGLNWFVYACNNPVTFVDPFGLYTAGNTVIPGGEPLLVTNIEAKETGLYGSLRSIADYTQQPYNLEWEENGEGAIVRYSFGSVHTMTIYFDSREPGTYASKIDYTYTVKGKTYNFTNSGSSIQKKKKMKMLIST